MKRFLFTTSALALIMTSTTQAANVAVIATPPTLLDTLVLGLAVFATVTSMKVFDLVRGGLLSKSWQFFAGGFAALALAQLLRILNAMEVFSLPSFVVPAVVMIMIGLFIMGVIQTRKTLG
ncbi:hypothetical protein GF356_02420 [candidate division GN15 bacterium]|nr:hypothetical protein [candidate division GN15 bacterium]